MPVTLDISNPPTGTKSEMITGKEYTLSPEASSQPVYTKYESRNKNLSDTLHRDPWEEEFTRAPTTRTGKARLTGSNGEEISVDQGIILRFKGHLRGEVGIQNGRIMTEAEADDVEEATGRSVPRFSAWDFYLVSGKQTNGPQLRFNLQKSQDEQRQEELTEMATAIRGAFQEAIGKPNGEVPTIDPQEALNKLSDEQLMAIIETRKAEEDAAAQAIEAEGQELEPAISVESDDDPAEPDAPRRGRPRKNG